MESSLMVFFVLIMMLVTFGGGLYLRAFLTRRAIFKVIKIFYHYNALGMKDAKTRRELGLEHPDFLQRMMRPRDYKQVALQILIRRGIVLEDQEGRLYMVEEKLDHNLRSKGYDLLSRDRS